MVVYIVFLSLFYIVDFFPFNGCFEKLIWSSDILLFSFFYTCLPSFDFRIFFFFVLFSLQTKCWLSAILHSSTSPFFFFIRCLLLFYLPMQFRCGLLLLFFSSMTSSIIFLNKLSNICPINLNLLFFLQSF